MDFQHNHLVTDPQIEDKTDNDIQSYMKGGLLQNSLKEETLQSKGGGILNLPRGSIEMDKESTYSAVKKGLNIYHSSEIMTKDYEDHVTPNAMNSLNQKLSVQRTKAHLDVQKPMQRFREILKDESVMDENALESNNHTNLDRRPTVNDSPNLNGSEVIEDVEDDEVIVLEADHADLIDQEMMQVFDKKASHNQLRGLPPNLDGVEMVCRICLGEDDEPESNPLFSPCKCAGSMGLIHLECLKEWLKSKKIQRIGEIVSTYFWKNLECELCKERFPVDIQLPDGRQFRILDYELPTYQMTEQPTYISLESISSNTSKVVHVLNLLYQDDISLGRGHDVDVRVTDISVSRLHGHLKKTESGYFYIQDNDSKFGTLALVRQPSLINSSCNNVYQVGKTLIVFETEQ